MRASTSLRLILAVRSSILRLVLLEAASIRSIFAWLLLLPLLLTAKYISQLLIHTAHTPPLSSCAHLSSRPPSPSLSRWLGRAPSRGGVAGPRHGGPAAPIQAGPDSAAAQRGAPPLARPLAQRRPGVGTIQRRPQAQGEHAHLSYSLLLLSGCSKRRNGAWALSTTRSRASMAGSVRSPTGSGLVASSLRRPASRDVAWGRLQLVCAASTSPLLPCPRADNPHLRHRRESLSASPVSLLLQRAYSCLPSLPFLFDQRCIRPYTVWAERAAQRRSGPAIAASARAGPHAEAAWHCGAVGGDALLRSPSPPPSSFAPGACW
jgi:hypothetical protein